MDFALPPETEALRRRIADFVAAEVMPLEADPASYDEHENIAIPVLEQSEAEWDLALDTNLKGSWLMTQETARHMVRLGHGGSIINIASVLGLKAEKQVIGYAASKAGLVHMTRALALELARYKIRVNAICPGYFPSQMTEGFLSGPIGEGLIARIPQRRLGAYADLEGPLLLLASDAGAYMTGSVLVVDGGLTL